MVAIGTIIALAVSVIAAVILFKVLKSLMPLIYNGLIGIAAFWILNLLGITHVSIDIWTFLIAAIGGVFGVAAVIILSVLGVPL
ncbi:SigmaK-factor processing regulatory protein BofA [uncultured archaeon]|nr:SigmaK-factor processing regulatory protein BofA [uncultured archaeon]